MAAKGKNPLGSKLKDYEKIEVVELSGFNGRGVTRAALKELIEGINLLPNVKMLKLKNNGLTDDFVEEVEQIFDMEKLRSIDLSANNFVKVGDVIGQKMKEKIKHVQFLDMTLNFIPNEGNIALYYGLQKQENLMYFGLSVKETLADNIIKHIPTKKPIAISLAGSAINENGAIHLAKSLKTNKANPCMLVDLNLKQTFISAKQLQSISDALRTNQYLLKLNLSHNYISDVQGAAFISMLADNTVLKELILSYNLLGLKSCRMVKKVVKTNDNVQIIDLSHNPIDEKGA